MKTILPSGYNFSPNKLINFSDYNWKSIGSIVFAILMAIAVAGLTIIFIQSFSDTLRESDGRDMPLILRLLYLIIIAISVIILAVSVTYVPLNSSVLKTDIYVHHDFRYPINNTNLIIKCVNSSNRMFKIEKPIADIPQDVSDHKQYPYKLYAKQGSKKHYLGTMKNNDFEPAINTAGVAFYQYLKYIHQHHLESKFAHALYFKQSSKYPNNNKAQWILTNGDDMVLHLQDNSHRDELKVIEN